MSYTPFGVSIEGQSGPERGEEKQQRSGNNGLQRKLKQSFTVENAKEKPGNGFQKPQRSLTRSKKYYVFLVLCGQNK